MGLFDEVVLTARQRRLLAAHAWATLAFYLVAGVLFRPQQLGVVNSLLALGVVYLGTLPFTLYLGMDKRPPIPLIPMISLFYAVSFGAVMYSDAVLTNGPLGWNSVVWRRALAVALCGVLSLMAGCFLSHQVVFGRLRPIRLPNPADALRRLHRLAWPLLLLHTAAIAGNWNDNVPTFGNLLATGGGYMSLALFFMLWTSGQLTKTERILVAFVFLPLHVLLRFSSGFLSQVVFLVLQFLLLYWRHYRRVLWQPALGALAFFIAFSPIKEEYRYAAWDLDRYASSLSVTERSELLLDLAALYYLQGANFGGATSDADKIFTRLSNITTLGYVVHATPAYVPYWGGTSYVPLLSKVVPRILWPDKPLEHIGNEFGHRYSMINPVDTNTSVNLNQMIEGYVNFGFAGAILAMAVSGFVLGFLDRWLNSPWSSDAEAVLGASCLLQLLVPESNMSIVYGGLMYAIPLYYLVLRTCLTIRLRSSPA